MADDQGGPWGGGGKNSGGDGETPWGKRPQDTERPDNHDNDFNKIIRDGQAQLRRIVGGGGGGDGTNRGGSSGRSNRWIWILAVLGLFAFWLFQSVHFIQPSDQALVMRFGKYQQTWGEGPHFAFWPIHTVETENVQDQRTERIGVGQGTSGQDWSLMLTSDENIIDIEFDVVWRIKDLAAYRLNIQGPIETIHAVAQSSIREVTASSPLMPLLNEERQSTKLRVKDLIQEDLDKYNSGIEVMDVNLRSINPPQAVIKDFEDVQAAEQTRDKLSSEAQAVANRRLAAARGTEAQLLEQAEQYRSRVVNEAEGEAQRFDSILEEYRRAPEVTRRRLYLETMGTVYENLDKVIIDERTGEGVVPYLPLNELRKGASQ